MKTFTQPMQGLKEFEDLEAALPKLSGVIQISGCIDAAKPHMMYSIGNGSGNRIIVTFQEQKAKELAEEYRFIRTVSIYGAAVLPLLNALEWSGNAKWHKRLMADVRAQAAMYPRFLQPRIAMSDALTAAELQVLRLVCADKSNAEIGEILDIRVSTVKSHVSSVLSKLGVNRRSEARTAAKKLWLISEDQ